jgi:hypothetical protein
MTYQPVSDGSHCYLSDTHYGVLALRMIVNPRRQPRIRLCCTRKRLPGHTAIGLSYDELALVAEEKHSLPGSTQP